MKNNSSKIIIGIDIGSSTLRAISCTYEEGMRFPEVLAIYKKPLEGMSKGNVLDVTEVSEAISDAILTLEEKVDAQATYTLVSIAGTHLTSHHASGYAQVTRGDAAITDLDVENAIKDGNKGVPDIRNKTVIHSIPIRYKIDGNDTDGNILGLHGNKLEVKTLFITCSNNSINNLKESLNKADVRVTDIVTGPIAESIPLLTKKQKIAGVILLNIGAQTTSMLVYENNTPLLVSVIPVGGDDITKDLALGLKVSLEEAEDIKRGKVDKHYNKRRFDEIVEARIDDLCTKINKELDRINRRELLPAGVIVCGGSSNIEKLDYMLRAGLKLPIKITKNELSRLTGNTLTDTEWARVYGLTFLAPKDTGNEVLKDLISSFVSRVKRFFVQFLP